MSLPFDKTLRRIYLSTWDFEEAVTFIEAAAKHDESTIEHKALMLSAILCYARPFSGNEIGKDPPADPRLSGIDVQALLGADFSLHERIVRLRNIAVAHSATEVNPSERLPTTPSKPGSYGIVFSARRWHPVDEQIDFGAFRRIAATMLRKCQDLIVEVPRKEAGLATAPHFSHAELVAEHAKLKADAAQATTRAPASKPAADKSATAYALGNVLGKKLKGLFRK